MDLCDGFHAGARVADVELQCKTLLKLIAAGSAKAYDIGTGFYSSTDKKRLK